MDKKTMLQAFKLLDRKLSTKIKLLMGGGAAMLLVYDFLLSTLDIDALVFQGPLKISDLSREIHAVSDALGIPKDWLNSYFETFLYTLPSDFTKRLQSVYQGKNLHVVSLGLEDLLILKCFAGRDKDIPHARAILKRKMNTHLVEDHLEALLEKNIPKARQALDFFDDLKTDLGL